MDGQDDYILMMARIQELEKENAALKAKLAGIEAGT